MSETIEDQIADQQALINLADQILDDNNIPIEDLDDEELANLVDSFLVDALGQENRKPFSTLKEGQQSAVLDEIAAARTGARAEIKKLRTPAKSVRVKSRETAAASTRAAKAEQASQDDDDKPVKAKPKAEERSTESRGRVTKSTRTARSTSPKGKKKSSDSSISGDLERAGIDEEAFMRFVKPGENVEEDADEATKRQAKREDLLEVYKNPYMEDGKPTLLKDVVKINERFIKQLFKAAIKLARVFGKYGNDAGFTALETEKPKKYYTVVTHDKYNDLIKLIEQRTKIANYFQDAKSTRPSMVIPEGAAFEELSSEKKTKAKFPGPTNARVVLTPEALDWVRNEVFKTMQGENFEGFSDFRTYLAKKTGKAFDKTFTGRGMLTRGAIDSLIKLALKPHRVPVKKVGKKAQAGYAYTAQMIKDFKDRVATNSEKEDDKGKFIKVDNTKNLSVLGVLSSVRYADKDVDYPFSQNVLYQKYMAGLSQNLGLSKDEATAKHETFMGEYDPAVHDAFLKEMALIRDFTKSVSDTYTEAQTETRKAAAKKKKEADKRKASKAPKKRNR